ncbi:hypothetical protein RRG08_026440 [Elysia crispata]|uniref:Phorbol-ester/DAG-type domain-containing protein n=1 Tax=Elysia crispata TaxID=231223 RepID=A0AAE0Y453_9GAST|nr:hypothetical protein RRG08_026440 [Elysia crispata]
MFNARDPRQELLKKLKILMRTPTSTMRRSLEMGVRSLKAFLAMVCLAKISAVNINRPHAFSADQLDRVVNHIGSFRERQLHYSRKDTQKLYLPEDLNMAKMHGCTRKHTQMRSAVMKATAPIATHRLVLLEGKKEKRCFVCSTPAQRKRSKHWCPACKVGCHEKCEAQLTHEDNLGLRMQRKRRAQDDAGRDSQ